ncbi:MAG: hypothetical protein WD009_05045 [Phycisphaeraceae bacterium]
MQAVGETWRFELAHTAAERVYLVHDVDGILSVWKEMRRDVHGRWVLTAALAPGRHRLHYCTLEGRSVLFGGATGLTGRRIAGHDPRVHVRADQ